MAKKSSVSEKKAKASSVEEVAEVVVEQPEQSLMEIKFSLDVSDALHARADGLSAWLLDCASVVRERVCAFFPDIGKELFSLSCVKALFSDKNAWPLGQSKSVSGLYTEWVDAKWCRWATALLYTFHEWAKSPRPRSSYGFGVHRFGRNSALLSDDIVLEFERILHLEQDSKLIVDQFSMVLASCVAVSQGKEEPQDEEVRKFQDEFERSYLRFVGNSFQK